MNVNMHARVRILITVLVLCALQTVLLLFFLWKLKDTENTGINAKERARVLGDCNGEYKGKKLDKQQIKDVLVSHAKWLNAYENNLSSLEAQRDSRKANLCGTDLKNADFTDANLRGAILNGADLDSADLNRANLTEAKLRAAVLTAVNFETTALNDADLSYADLSDAGMVMGVDLGKADLFSADMKAVNIETIDNLPDVDEIAYARNLSTLRFTGSPKTLARLRNAFKEAGYRQQEREMTYAIKHSEIDYSLASSESGILLKIDRHFQYYLFDLTTKWGMEPGRALIVLLFLIPLFAYVYMVGMIFSNGDGIWQRWPEKRLRQDLGESEPVLLKVTWQQAIGIGLYFSLLSAFSIGWRELNVGNWIQRIQSKEYSLEATGWLRTVAGFQSLVSVYLLAIWALTYFGRPFE